MVIKHRLVGVIAFASITVIAASTWNGSQDTIVCIREFSRVGVIAQRDN